MYYTIKYADGISVLISLDKNGNKYIVCVWNKGEHRIEQMKDFDVYAEAESYFEGLCKAYALEKFIKEVNHEAFDFSNID